MGITYNGVTIDGVISDIQIHPVTRAKLTVQPVLGDGVFVKRGQLQDGSVSFSVTTDTDTEVGTVAQNLANLCGFSGILAISNMGSWSGAMLTDVGTLTVKFGSKKKYMISYSLTFTLLP